MGIKIIMSEHGLLIRDTTTGETYRVDGTIVNDSPVREVTRREIVPGTYGRVKVGEDGWVGLTSCDFQHGTYMTAEELREAAHILNQIAEAME